MNLYMEETLKHQLSREMILESDMAEVIAWCESTGRKVKNSSGHFIGHKKIQNMTYWLSTSRKATDIVYSPAMRTGCVWRRRINERSKTERTCGK